MIWKGKPLTSGKKGSWAQATGSHVIWKGKPLTRWKKGSWAQATGSHVIWKGKPLTSSKKGSWAQATGSHVIWKGKPLTSSKKGSRAQGSHVIWETADQVENSIVGSRGRKTAGETRAQSPKSKLGGGGDPWSENNTKLINTFYCYTFVYNN